MTNKFKLRIFFFFLHLSLGLQDTNPQNTTVFRQYNNKSELQPTGVLLQTATIRKEQSAAVPTSYQSTSETAGPLQGNGTSGILHNLEENDTTYTKHQPASTNNPFPEIQHSLDPVMPSSASTLPSSLGRNQTNSTNTSFVRTTSHILTDKSSTSTTTKPVAIPFTEMKTTLNHQPQSTQKIATNICTTAEPKGENLVGRCLLAIASLAAITTIFIMTTVILATKLAGSGQRQRSGLLHETEMVCISTLINDSDYPVPTPRRPKSNGALIPITEDEDGDDLTLNSFLHDTDVVV